MHARGRVGREPGAQIGDEDIGQQHLGPGERERVVVRVRDHTGLRHALGLGCECGSPVGGVEYEHGQRQTMIASNGELLESAPSLPAHEAATCAGSCIRSPVPDAVPGPLHSLGSYKQ
ncbi:hypothetical protein GCM10009646_86320 [Streptomyces aureus]